MKITNREQLKKFPERTICRWRISAGAKWGYMALGHRSQITKNRIPAWWGIHNIGHGVINYSYVSPSNMDLEICGVYPGMEVQNLEDLHFAPAGTIFKYHSINYNRDRFIVFHSVEGEKIRCLWGDTIEQAQSLDKNYSCGAWPRWAVTIDDLGGSLITEQLPDSISDRNLLPYIGMRIESEEDWKMCPEGTILQTYSESLRRDRFGCLNKTKSNGGVIYAKGYWQDTDSAAKKNRLLSDNSGSSSYTINGHKYPIVIHELPKSTEQTTNHHSEKKEESEEMEQEKSEVLKEGMLCTNKDILKGAPEGTIVRHMNPSYLRWGVLDKKKTLDASDWDMIYARWYDSPEAAFQCVGTGHATWLGGTKTQIYYLPKNFNVGDTIFRAKDLRSLPRGTRLRAFGSKVDLELLDVSLTTEGGYIMRFKKEEFEVGDRVICDTAPNNRKEPPTFMRNMEQFLRQVLTVGSVKANVLVRENGYAWNPKWLRLEKDFVQVLPGQDANNPYIIQSFPETPETPNKETPHISKDDIYTLKRDIKKDFSQQLAVAKEQLAITTTSQTSTLKEHLENLMTKLEQDPVEQNPIDEDTDLSNSLCVDLPLWAQQMAKESGLDGSDRAELLARLLDAKDRNNRVSKELAHKVELAKAKEPVDLAEVEANKQVAIQRLNNERQEMANDHGRETSRAANHHMRETTRLSQEHSRENQKIMNQANELERQHRLALAKIKRDELARIEVTNQYDLEKHKISNKSAVDTAKIGANKEIRNHRDVEVAKVRWDAFQFISAQVSQTFRSVVVWGVTVAALAYIAHCVTSIF